MIYQTSALTDARLILPEPRRDERGYFARLFCAEEFRREGLPEVFVQQNLSFSAQKGTLRGMHYQAEPHGEAKLVRCLRGAIHDVIVDLRPESPTFLQWAGFDLTAENMAQLLVPVGFAHGFQTLTDDAEVSYLVSYPYTQHAERGLRWDDPAIGIDWPLEPTTISEKDRSWPDINVAGLSVPYARGQERDPVA
jgi:dTDP-4-dehydrorhamnose 3,5-epimerase